MNCSSLSLYKAMCTNYRQNPTQKRLEALKTYRETHNLNLERAPITNNSLKALIQFERTI